MYFTMPREYLSIFLCLLVAVPVTQLKAQVAASFSSDTTQGCAPLVIRFRDQSTGSPVYWRWDLGNGTVSFNQNPSTTYFAAGRYTVKLYVRNAANQEDSVIKTQYITAYAPPVLNFRASDSTGCFPLHVLFTDLSLPGSGTITSWEWDFGDGFTSGEAHPAHTYTALGNYNVSLRITNSNGCVTTLSKPQYVRISSGATAGFNFTAPNSCRPPTPISFTNSSTGTGTLSYNWIFGDGNSSTLASPTHNYTTTGTFTVRLIVQNNAGCRDTLEKVNAITIGGVNAGFTVPAQICAGVNLPLVNTSSPTPSGAAWTFGDGSTSTLLNPVKSFANPGNYTIKLVSDFGACKDSITRPVTVLPKPAAAFSATNNLSCKAPLPVSFTSNALNATTYKWLFGDGSISTEQNPAHLYQQGGRYDVTLVVTAANGCTDSLRKPAFVQIVPAEVSVKNLPLQGCVPLTFTPVPVVNSVDPIASWLWDFGDGSSSPEAVPMHVYTRPGIYTVKVFFTTRNGCRDSVQFKDQLMAGSPPKVSFSGAPLITCAFQPVRFTDATAGDPLTEWHWEFGDGAVSLERNPAHIYGDTGHFTVKLTVSSNGCKTDLVLKDYVSILPPVALFRDSSSCTNPLSRKFFDRSIGATSWFWNFGDSTSSTERNPLHTYTKAGSYVVTLTVKNDSCENTIRQQILIVAEKADFFAGDTVVCKGTNVLFQTRNLDPKNISQQVWYFGDGFNSGGSSPVAHRYSTNGRYTVRLFIRDVNGCADTLTRTQYIAVHGPVANFEAAVKSVCVRAAVAFNDLSVADTGTSIRQWNWKWGDGSQETLSQGPFQHTYTKGGDYPVQLTVTDSRGCVDSISKPGSIFIAQPLAAFDSPDSLSCYNKPIRFINQSAGRNLTQTWSFGDGLASLLFQPVHSYLNEGSYTIGLVVKDQSGCLDSTSKPAYIRIRNPKPAFSVNDSLATCPPLVTTFTNQSQNYTGYEWNFGDGTRSTVDNPTHFYNSSGTFIAKLVITSPGGCKDSATRKIVVRGPQGDLTYEKTTACLPVTMQFKANTKDNLSFLWDFNDGTTVASPDSLISHTFTIAGSYLPKIILIDPQGCKVPVEGKDTIHVLGVTANFTADKGTVCDSGKVQFTDASKTNDPIVSYQWEPGDGAPVSGQQNPVHYYKQVGTFPVKLTVSTLHGCTDSIRKATDLLVVPSPVTGIAGDSAGCAPAAVRWAGEVLKPDTATLRWRWNFGNGQTANTQNPLPVTYGQAGSYTVSMIASNASGCSDTTLKTIQVHPSPLVDAGPNAVICKGGTYQLQGANADRYNWSPSLPLSCTTCSNPVAVPGTTTIFRLQGETIFGCKGQDSVIIEVKQPFKLGASLGDTLCTGNSLTLFATGAELYSWTPAAGLDNPNIPGPKASPATTTTYRVIGTDTKGCFSDTSYVPVVVYPYPTVEAGEDKTISVGSSINLTPRISSDVTDIRWQPVTGLSCTDCRAPVAAPRQTTTYTLNVGNQGACVAKDELTIFVVCREGNLYMPNLFSPNGDGNNDVFYPRGKGIYGVRSFKIFNRWGEIVYEKYNFQVNDASPAAGWNGRYKNKDAGQDVYVYIIEVVCENNTVIQYKGNVTLVR